MNEMKMSSTAFLGINTDNTANEVGCCCSSFSFTQEVATTNVKKGRFAAVAPVTNTTEEAPVDV